MALYIIKTILFGGTNGVIIIPIKELFEHSSTYVMQQACAIFDNIAIYCSFDIDFIDPTHTPGAGTPEISGVNSFQTQQIIPELKGVNLISANLVEISPPVDSNSTTICLGASMLSEILCKRVIAKKEK